MPADSWWLTHACFTSRQEPDYIKEFIDEQKKKFKWSEAAGAFYDTLDKSHISHVDLQEKLLNAGKEATGHAADEFFALVSGAVKYRNFLKGLLHKGEVIGMTVLSDRIECLPLQNAELVERTVPAFRKYLA